MIMKFSWKNYYEPTPTNFRKWGDMWAVFWGSLGISQVALSNKWIAIGFLVFAGVGKAFSNFFTNNNPENKQ